MKSIKVVSATAACAFVVLAGAAHASDDLRIETVGVSTIALTDDPVDIGGIDGGDVLFDIVQDATLEEVPWS